MLRIELNIGTLCNFRCKYCFENGENKNIIQTTMTYDTIIRFVEYVKFLKEKYNDDMYLAIFGGEPLLQMSKLTFLIENVYEYFQRILVVSNGYYIPYNINILSQLKKNINNFNIAISYDYIFQNETRQSNTYDIVRNAIRIAYHNNLNRGTNTVFNSSTINRIDEAFFDFISLKKELPELHFGFSLDRYDKGFKNVNLIKLKESLLSIKQFSHKNSLNYRDFFFINTFNGVGYNRLSSIQEGKFFNDIHIAITYNGNLYPGYELETESKPVRELLYISNIFDNFETIENNRNNLLNKLPKNIPNKCKLCSAHCRVVPWLTMKNNILEYNTYGDEGICKIHKLISEIFYDE